MAIKFLAKLIEPMKNPETGKKEFELSHWCYSTELPYVALRQHIGFYATYEKAEEESNMLEISRRFNNE